MASLVHARRKIFIFLFFLVLIKDFLESLALVRGSVRIGDTYIDDTVCPAIPEAPDQNITTVAIACFRIAHGNRRGLRIFRGCATGLDESFVVNQ